VPDASGRLLPLRKQQEPKARVQARYTTPVVTEIEPAKDFWRAEDYHRQYLVKRGGAGRLI
jgi:peptide-methionine (S)-S-oxide reductase